MKHLQLLSVLICLIQFGFSQSSEVISETEMERYKQEIQMESEQLRQKLLLQDYYSDFEKQITVDFQVDTFKIERLLKKRISVDYSTSAMVIAAYDTEIEYDKLLNKYYKVLLGKLNETDKEILKQSQRNWIQFRDSERKLNGELSKDEYSGGGTLQSIIVASGYADITKKRVFEIYSYLNRFSE